MQKRGLTTLSPIHNPPTDDTPLQWTERSVPVFRTAISGASCLAVCVTIHTPRPQATDPWNLHSPVRPATLGEV